MIWIDWLSKLPGAWALILSIGSIVGGGVATVIFVVAHRRLGVLITEQRRDLLNTHAEQIKAQKELLEMQKAHCDYEIAELRAILEKQANDMKEERDDYRKKLHAEKNEHQASLLQLKELELRPDLSKLYESEKLWNEERKKVYADFSKTLTLIAKSITDHDTEVTVRVKPMEKALATLLENSGQHSKALQALLERLPDQNGK